MYLAQEIRDGDKSNNLSSPVIHLTIQSNVCIPPPSFSWGKSKEEHSLVSQILVRYAVPMFKSVRLDKKWQHSMDIPFHHIFRWSWASSLESAYHVRDYRIVVWNLELNHFSPEMCHCRLIIVGTESLRSLNRYSRKNSANSGRDALREGSGFEPNAHASNNFHWDIWCLEVDKALAITTLSITRSENPPSLNFSPGDTIVSGLDFEDLGVRIPNEVDKLADRLLARRWLDECRECF